MYNTRTTCSTGHKELDDILKKNGIIDQEEQQKKQNQDYQTFNVIIIQKNDHQEICAHESYNESLVRTGQAQNIDHAAMIPRMLHCRCKKCNPFTL